MSCCEKNGKIQLIDFLVVNVPPTKPPLRCGRDAQALVYLKIYADEIHTLETTNGRVDSLLIGEMTKDDVVTQYRLYSNLEETSHLENLYRSKWTLTLGK